MCRRLPPRSPPPRICASTFRISRVAAMANTPSANVSSRAVVTAREPTGRPGSWGGPALRALHVEPDHRSGPAGNDLEQVDQLAGDPQAVAGRGGAFGGPVAGQGIVDAVAEVLDVADEPPVLRPRG